MLTGKGRSYYELDVMFERKVPARKFKTYVVDMDADEQMRREQGIARS
jgi:SP family general alpha glucoside:H+ symporter-like MFS transporter